MEAKKDEAPSWYLTSEGATNLDRDLMSSEGESACHYNVYQLMELAGLAVA